MPTAEEVDEQAREKVVTVLRDKIRLVAHPLSLCETCEEPLTWKVKDGCLEECAKEIVKQLYS